MTQENQNVITTFSGRETHQGGYSNIGMHVLTGRGLEPLATAAKDEAITGLRFVNKTTSTARSVSSVAGLSGDLVGKWVQRQVAVPDGTPLLVRWVRCIKGQDEEKGIGMFVCRRGYPFLQAEWPTVPLESSTRSWVGLTGRCRNVTIGELRSRGIIVPKVVEVMLNDSKMLQPEIRTLEPGYIAVPEIIQREIEVEGETKVITTSRRRRKLEV